MQESSEIVYKREQNEYVICDKVRMQLNNWNAKKEADIKVIFVRISLSSIVNNILP